MLTDNLLDISVIICAYTQDRWLDIIAAVESIQKQQFPPREIILVIDHNIKLFEQAQAQMRGVILIENNEQQGLSGARNSGIAIAKGALIAFVDDDAVAEPDWLMRLNQFFEDPQILGVGGRVEPIWSGKCPAWFPKEFYWVVGCSYLGLPEKLSVVRNPFGGCTCYRREVFEVVGGFRNGIGRVGKLPMGGEETELCIRARQHWPEKNFLYDPQAKIHHHVPPSRATLRYFRSRCYSEGLSKALIARLVGANDSLSSERSYTLRTLPSGVIRGLIEGLFHRDMHGVIRAGANIYGFFMTACGYLMGSMSQRLVPIKNANSGLYRNLEQPLHSNN
jgi:GT2 family glycosyltransferase